MRTIAQEWTRFEAAVLPPEAGQVQRQEMRRAFYAGCHTTLTLGMQMAAESGDNDDVGATMMDRLHRECLQFVDDIQKGKA